MCELCISMDLENKRERLQERVRLSQNGIPINPNVNPGKPIIEPIVYETEPQPGFTDAPMDFDQSWKVHPSPPPTTKCQCDACVKYREMDARQRAYARGVGNAYDSIMSRNPLFDKLFEQKRKEEGMREIGFSDKLEDGNKFGLRSLPVEYEPVEMKWKEDEKIKDILSHLFESVKPQEIRSLPPIKIEPDDNDEEEESIFDMTEILQKGSDDGLFRFSITDYGCSITIDKTKFRLEFDKNETEKEVTIKLVKK